MRRCPGMLFADGPMGRRAGIEGSGVEVREFVASYLAWERDEAGLRVTYHWFTERQSLAASGYYRA